MCALQVCFKRNIDPFPSCLFQQKQEVEGCFFGGFLKSALMSARAVLCSFIHGTRAKQAEGHLYFTLSLCGSTWYWTWRLSLCSVAWFLPLNINIFYHWISLVFLTLLLFLCQCWPSPYCLFCPRCDACCLCVFNRILNFTKPSWADVCCVLLSDVCICSDLFLLWDVGCVPGLSVASVSHARQLASLCHHLISTSLIWLKGFIHSSSHYNHERLVTFEFTYWRFLISDIFHWFGFHLIPNIMFVSVCLFSSSFKQQTTKKCYCWCVPTCIYDVRLCLRAVKVCSLSPRCDLGNSDYPTWSVNR